MNMNGEPKRIQTNCHWWWPWSAWDTVCDLPGLRVAAAHIVMCPSLLIFCLQYPAWMLAWYHWCDWPWIYVWAGILNLHVIEYAHMQQTCWWSNHSSIQTLDENLNFLIQDKCSTAGVSCTFPKTHHTSCSQDRAKFPVHFPAHVLKFLRTGVGKV